MLEETPPAALDSVFHALSDRNSACDAAVVLATGPSTTSASWRRLTAFPFAGCVKTCSRSWSRLGLVRPTRRGACPCLPHRGWRPLCERRTNGFASYERFWSERLGLLDEIIACRGIRKPPTDPKRGRHQTLIAPSSRRRTQHDDFCGRLLGRPNR